MRQLVSFEGPESTEFPSAFPSPQSPSGGAAGFSVDGIAAKPQSTERQNANVAGSMS
jgi:hypothetical protein